MSERDDVRRAYDALAETYAAQRSRDSIEMALLDRLLDSVPRDARVLDAGCGQGAPVLERIAESAAGVGLDFSREQLRLATENAPTAALVRGDMTRLPFRDDAFDGATAYYSLIHVPLDDHRTVVDELARVLRPGGRLIVSEGMEEWCGSNPDWLGSGVEMRWNVAGAERTRAQLDSAGFSVLDVRTVAENLPEDGEDEDEEAAEDDGDDVRHPFFLAELR
jgi:SAM-dependent methyltransferase